VRRPPDSESIVAACLANSAVFDRSGAIRMSVTSSIRSVTAAAAARAINDSKFA
jgi:hypothetical protein